VRKHEKKISKKGKKRDFVGGGYAAIKIEQCEEEASKELGCDRKTIREAAQKKRILLKRYRVELA